MARWDVGSGLRERTVGSRVGLSWDDDLQIDLLQPKKGLGAVRKNGFLVLMVDGSGMFQAAGTPPETLKAFITINDGETVRLP